MQLTQKKRQRTDLLTVAAVAALFVVMAALLYTGHLTRQVTNMLVPVAVYIVMAVSLNLVVGLLGELSLGHAGFMSVGLFSGCLVAIALHTTALPLGVRLPVSMLAGGLMAAVFGLLVGLPALRLRGDYLAIVTLACGEIIKNIITNLNITGGALGLDTSSIYAGAKDLLPYGAVLVLLTVAVMLNLKRSKYGRAIMAIRDNRIAAESVGLNVTWYKLAVFVIAAFFAGCAGVLYGHSLANIKAAAFDYNMSIEILVIVVLGGMGSVPGSVISAIVLTVLPEALREVADYRMLVYAIVLILVMQATNNPTMKRFFASAKEKLTPGERSVRRCDDENEIGEAPVLRAAAGTGHRQVPGAGVRGAGRDLRRAEGSGGLRSDHRPDGDRGADRPQRRGQDHGVQPADEGVSAHSGRYPAGWQGHPQHDHRTGKQGRYRPDVPEHPAVQ